MAHYPLRRLILTMHSVTTIALCMEHVDAPTPDLLQGFMIRLSLSCVTPLQKAELEEPIWLEEVIGQIARNKTLGTERLPFEYCATFSALLTQSLLEMFNEAR
ncbi:hypothetical protein NDU88_001945, partial [Pleurodeles waltl]